MMRVLALASIAAGSAAGEDKQRPVAKVVSLLKDMQKQLEEEAEKDQEVFDKMQCWCTTNDKDKTQAIKDAEGTIDELTGTIEEASAQSARLSTEITNLEKEVAANTAALDKATALRQEQLAEFNAEEKDYLKSLAALKAAITVLSGHHEKLLQKDSSALVNVAALLRHHKYKYGAVMDKAITPYQKEQLTVFLENPFKSYAPQSGAIFGILKNMKENFETNLSSAQTEESENNKAYESLKEAKEKEIEAGQEQINVKTTQLGDTDEKLAESKQQMRDTKLSLSADEEFLLDLKKKCQMTGQEWEERQKTRQEEIAAVSQALEVLSGDEAHATFSKTYSFVQVDSSRLEASAVLKKAAATYQNKDLNALAEKVKLDAFTKVKKAIDDMIANLQKEGTDEIKLRDWCTESLDENERQASNRRRDHKDVSARIEDFKANIKKLTRAIETFNAEIAELKAQMKQASEDRAAENKEFQATVADQRASQALLQKAYDHLASFYSKKSFLAASPAGFNTYENSAGGNTVLKLLQTIMNDTKTLEKETTTAEEDAQKAYEGFVAETDSSVNTKTKARIDAEEDKAKAEVDLGDAQETREGLQFTLDELEVEKTDTHKQCDFVLKNFEVRQEARIQEVEALRQAKSILSGANFGFLQRS